MKSSYDLIKKFNMIKCGDTVGVAFSGGSDSMALLHFLCSIKSIIGFDVVAIHINHGIRKESEDEAKFVKTVCKDLKVPLIYKKLNVLAIAKKQKLGIEECARSERYKVFDKVIEDKKVDKIALAHHASDQAETVLLHILRGSGINGACGMDYIRGSYIRPFLDTSKSEIVSYIKKNSLNYVTDCSNECNDYSRNFIRNIVFKDLNKKFVNAEKAFCEFAKNCKNEQSLLQSFLDFEDVKNENNVVKIPLKYFKNVETLAHYAIGFALNILGVYKDFSRKHTQLICQLAYKKNGTSIDLPQNVTAIKDYNYLSLVIKKQKCVIYEPLSEGDFCFKNETRIKIKKYYSLKNAPKNALVLDFDKLPKDCVIRCRQDGDVFKKFGGGEKKLKEYFIDKKISAYCRDDILLIANSKKIFCVVGYEISDEVKYDEKTKTYLAIILLK